MLTIKKALKNELEIINTRSPPNREGNCSEYLTWPVVCRFDGRYKSLCLNMAEQRAYRCCGHCKRTLEKLGANGVQIDDLWKTSHLSIAEGNNKEHYPYRKLENHAIIIQKYKNLTNV